MGCQNVYGRPRGVTVLYNPSAGNKNTAHYARQTVAALTGAVPRRTLALRGDINLTTTWPDAQHRINHIHKTLERRGSANSQYVFVVGGDGTVAEVVTALQQTQLAKTTTVVPLPAGTANDLARICGVPRAPRRLVEFLRVAQPYPLEVAEVALNGVSQRTLLVQALTVGVSGELFAFMQTQQVVGRARHLQYVSHLLRQVVRTRSFQMHHADRLFIGGELIISGSTSLGGIATLPLPSAGLRAFFVPTDPQKPGIRRLTGAVPLTEVMVRKVAYLCGAEQWALGGKLFFMDDERQVSLAAGDDFTVRLADLEGRAPRGLKAVLNGDYVADHVETIEVQPLADAGVRVLAHPRSELARRKRSLFPE